MKFILASMDDLVRAREGEMQLASHDAGIRRGYLFNFIGPRTRRDERCLIPKSCQVVMIWF